MKRKIKISLFIVVTMLLLSLVTDLFIARCFPVYTFKERWAVPVFFCLFYICASLSLPPGMTSKQFTIRFIGLKAAKMFFSMFFIALLAFVMRDDVISIVINFFVYYVLLLVPECAYGIYMKKHIR